MLPMRTLFSALVVAAIATLVGCRNQTTTLTNPFLTPDRVPPPSTRVLAPGAAQPYYPGDPLPNAATGAAPVIAAPPGAFPPGQVFAPVNSAPPTPTYPANPAPQTMPPGGWGAFAPQSQVTPGEVIPTQGDQLPLRFEPQQFSASAAPLAPSAPIAPTVQPATFAQAPTMQTPAFPANAGAQTPTYPSPQRLQMREVTPAEYQAPQIASAAPITPTRDGFRPQSGEPRTDDASSQSFRPPEIRRSSFDESAAGPSDQFAVGDNFQTLRGQLEYWPETGMWTVRYLPAGSPADSIGGRVIVDNPQVLANLQPGELVAVSGQLYAKPSDDGTAKPAYRVATVQRQRQ